MLKTFKMKKFHASFLLLFVTFLFPFNLVAQSIPKEAHLHNGQRCMAHEMQQKMENKDPQAKERRIKLERFTRDVLKRKNYFYDGQIITIPVVVHVVHFNEEENISDEQIHSQIDIINEDFRRLNADRVNTPAIFQDVAADVQIEFCLASIDPNGYSTTGITRTNTYNDNFYIFSGEFDFVKFDATGGRDAWPTDQYLNMWVADLPLGLLGYATFPEGFSSDIQGVVMTTNGFGNTGTAAAPFDLGRTTTHEIGHYLNLRHIWGDGDCSVDDFVEDTPLAADPNFDGLPCEFPSRNSCEEGPNDLPDMFQNYMDYSDDACMNMFTQGQKSRMLALFEPGGPRESLLYSNGCGQNSFGRGRRPTCSDGVRNGDETGVDCGGSCGDPCPITSYCASTSDLYFYEAIGATNFGGIENVSGSDGGYGDYTGIPLQIEAGQTLPFTIVPSFSFFPIESAYKIFIDYNEDFDFEDEGELVYDSQGASISEVSGEITIPTDVYGTKRIRVVMSAFDPTFFVEVPPACGIFLVGETEDYTLNILNCRPPANITHLMTSPNSISFHWDSVPDADHYVVAYSHGGITKTARTVKNDYRFENLADGYYEFTIKSKCANGFSYPSAPISVQCGGPSGNRLANNLGDNSLAEMQVHQVYPNPVSNELFVAFTAKGTQTVTLQITDIFGKTIEQISNIQAFHRQTRSLNVGTLSSGVYFVSLNDGQTQITRKFIKQ